MTKKIRLRRELKDVQENHPVSLRVEGSFNAAMAGKNLEERGFVGTQDLTHIWAGFRLSRLFAHVAAVLEACPIGDREELRKQYPALRKHVEPDDVYEWIDTLAE